MILIVTGVSGNSAIAERPDFADHAQHQLLKSDRHNPHIVLAANITSCVGGSVVKGLCRCGATQRRVKIGPKAYRCDERTTVSPSKRISCFGGSARAGGCSCSAGQRLIRTGESSWRCQKVHSKSPPSHHRSTGRLPDRSKGSVNNSLYPPNQRNMLAPR